MQSGVQSLQQAICGATAEELGALLLSLEGRVVNAGIVGAALADFRRGSNIAQRLQDDGTPHVNAAAQAKRARLEGESCGVLHDGSSSGVTAEDVSRSAESTGDKVAPESLGRTEDTARTPAPTSTQGSRSVEKGARGKSWQEKQQQKRSATSTVGFKKKKKRGGEREFDHARWRRRTVAIQLMYEGAKFAGFCSQTDGDENTIEKHLFHALTTTRLVESIATGENYSRCGRTDRGVSALGNVITVSVRSKFPKDADLKLPTSPLASLWVPAGSSDAGKTSNGRKSLTTRYREGDARAGGGRDAADAGSVEDAIDARFPADVGDRAVAGRKIEGPQDANGLQVSAVGSTSGAGTGREKGERALGGSQVTELDYCGMLNRVLPPEIRALAWAPVTDGFSARFSCSDRTYRYFFLARDLDTSAMDEAASRVVGEHDFRNLCKIDVANVSNFVRHVKHASVRVVPSPSADYTGSGYYRVCVFEVCGQAFLWHMVRCLMSVLFMVGRRLESPEIMSFLLDLDRCPAKPHYDMAPDSPLLLHSCSFRSLCFQYAPENLYSLQAHLESLWEEAAIKAARLFNNLDFLANMTVNVKDFNTFVRLKRSSRSFNLEHYSVRDHGLEGRRREAELRQQRQMEGDQDLQQQQQQQRRRDQEAASDASGRVISSPTRKSIGEKDYRGKESDGEDLTWREALARMRSLGLGPGQVLGRKGHMPMARRQQGLHYDELVQGLGGKKRQRLDRHLAMKTAGQRSGKTNAFYESMQQEGAVDGASLGSKGTAATCTNAK